MGLVRMNIPARRTAKSLLKVDCGRGGVYACVRSNVVVVRRGFFFFFLWCTHLLASHTLLPPRRRRVYYARRRIIGGGGVVARRIFSTLLQYIASERPHPPSPGHAPRPPCRENNLDCAPLLLRRVFVYCIFPCIYARCVCARARARQDGAYRDSLRAACFAALTSCFAFMITPPTVFITFLRRVHYASPNDVRCNIVKMTHYLICILLACVTCIFAPGFFFFFFIYTFSRLNKKANSKLRQWW